MGLDASTGVLVCVVLVAGAGIFLFSTWLLTRLRRAYDTIISKLSTVETGMQEVRQIAVSARIQNFNSNTIAQNHLIALRRNDQETPEISYALSRVVRSMISAAVRRKVGTAFSRGCSSAISCRKACIPTALGLTNTSSGASMRHALPTIRSTRSCRRPMSTASKACGSSRRRRRKPSPIRRSRIRSRPCFDREAGA
jgi:hypothetical protein